MGIGLFLRFSPVYAKILGSSGFNYILADQKRKDQWRIKIICCYYILLDFDVTLVSAGIPPCNLSLCPGAFQRGEGGTSTLSRHLPLCRLTILGALQLPVEISQS